MLKSKNLLLFFSYLFVIVTIIFFEVILYPFFAGSPWNMVFSNFFAKIFNLQMVISLIAIGVGACMLVKKGRAWSVRFLTVFISFAIFDLFLRTGSIMVSFFNCFNFPNSGVKTWLILESAFYILALGQFVAVLIVTKSWKNYVLGFKSIDAIETELDLEQVNQEIKEFEK